MRNCKNAKLRDYETTKLQKYETIAKEVRKKNNDRRKGVTMKVQHCEQRKGDVKLRKEDPKERK